MFQRVLSINSVRRAVVAVTAIMAGASMASAVHAPHADAAAFCKSGFVWREAFAGDYACVTPTDRSAVWSENSLGPSRILSSGWCVNGYVWREARPSDHVCVPPTSRSREVGNNANAVFRVADPRQTGYGGVSTYTIYNSMGGVPHVYGGGVSANAAIKIYAAGSAWSGPYGLATVYSNSLGQVNSDTGQIYCRRGFPEQATIIVADQKSGQVSVAGTSGALQHCG